MDIELKLFVLNLRIVLVMPPVVPVGASRNEVSKQVVLLVRLAAPIGMHKHSPLIQAPFLLQ